MGDVTIGLALMAGFLSFVSPCVLPLVPAYIGYMGGRMTRTVALQLNSGQEQQTLASRSFLLLHGVAFVLGFSVVFVAIGLMTTAFVSVVGGSVNVLTDIIGRVGGVLIIIFGLQFMGVLPRLLQWAQSKQVMLNNPLTSVVVAVLLSLLIAWGFVEILIALPVLAAVLLMMVLGGAFSSPGAFWNGVINTLQNALYSDTRVDISPNGREGLSGSFMMGVVFSAGWTPCIGPLLGTILTIAANTGDVSAAMPLLGAYSLGLGIPFIVTALLLNSLQGLFRTLQQRMRIIETVSGTLLVIIGLLVASGQLQILSQNLGNEFADISYTIEECGISAFEGDMPLAELGSCLNGSLALIVFNQGTSASLGPDRAAMTYLFETEDATAVDIEVSRLPDGFVPVVRLLGENGEVLASGDGLEPLDDEGVFLALQNAVLAVPGQYRLEVSGSDELAERNTFRVKVRAASSR